MESLQTIEEKEIAPPTYEVLLLNLITQFVNRSVPLEVERLFFPAEQISSVEDGHLNGLSLLGNAGCSPEKILTSSPQRLKNDHKHTESNGKLIESDLSLSSSGQSKKFRKSMGSLMSGCCPLDTSNLTTTDKVKLKFKTSAFDQSNKGKLIDDENSTDTRQTLSGNENTIDKVIDDSGFLVPEEYFFSVTPKTKTFEPRNGTDNPTGKRHSSRKSRKKEKKYRRSRDRKSNKRRRSSKASESDEEMRRHGKRERSMTPHSYSRDFFDSEKFIRGAMQLRDAAQPHYFPFFSTKFVFSNHFRCDIELNGKIFNCPEQYYMYMKAVVFGDEGVSNRILQSNDPKVQKKLSSEILNFNKTVWYDQHARNVMKEITFAKYRQHERLRKNLFDTFSYCLVEANPSDCRWGVGLDINDPNIHDRSRWRGDNWLGEILNEVRDLLMLESQYHSEAVKIIQRQSRRVSL